MNHLIFELVLRHGGLTDGSDYIALKMLSKCFAGVFTRVEKDCVSGGRRFGLKHEIIIQEHVFIDDNGELGTFDDVHVYKYGAVFASVTLLFEENKNGVYVRCFNKFNGPANITIVIKYHLLKPVKSLLDINPNAFEKYFNNFDMFVTTTSFEKSALGFTRRDLPRSWRQWFHASGCVVITCIDIIKNTT